MKKDLPWTAVEPAGDRYLGNVAREYLAERVDKPVWAAEDRAVRDYLSSLSPGARVLDVPFGTGRFAPVYLERGLQVAGIDISADMLSVAREEFGPAIDHMDIRVGDALSLPFEDGVFDAVVSIRFLESIIPWADVEACLREFARVCRGIAVVRLNNRLDTQPPAVAPAPSERMGSRFYLPEVTALVERCGWRLADSVVVQMDKDGKGEKRVALLQRLTP
ncbi:class I SAM-dependent methyltransferase [Pseudoxanthomonas sp. PXM02]|uniref:class I SAM-dependent methyltransferase n=1 Tax=Pseudoxanthomonas sp. PXM02 TaxID=2769294 RepID=UPI001782E268|nr:class I SAM-dependent methyltransferase [Pseudoxanthomonas sp. PXM02]MBD9480070.1 class I SAM-dependent methyltransferase [Pseudoxanthomonas sp. PXM02]